MYSAHVSSAGSSPPRAREGICTAKALLVRSTRGGECAIVVCAKCDKVDLRAVRRWCHWPGARLASLLELRALVDRDEGEVSPVVDVGVPVLLDVGLWAWDHVLLSGGRVGSYVTVSPSFLQNLPHASAAPISWPRWRWE